MKAPHTLFLLSLCVTLFFSCKNDDASSDQVVVKTVGTSGGTLISNNNSVVLTVPDGALDTDVAVSIQQTETVAPLGIGTIYKLEPEGLQFTKPVTLTFKYTDADAQTTDPELMAIAFKKSDNTWETLPNSILDKNTKTISAKTSHFSEWSIIKLNEVESNEGISFTTKSFSLSDMPGFISNDTLYGQNEDYRFYIFYNSELLNVNSKSGLIYLSLEPINFATDSAKHRIQLNQGNDFNDTTLTFIRVSKFPSGSDSTMVGDFSALVYTATFATNNGDTIGTKVDTLKGTFRLKN